jgi:hypothetical protein
MFAQSCVFPQEIRRAITFKGAKRGVHRRVEEEKLTHDGDQWSMTLCRRNDYFIPKFLIVRTTQNMSVSDFIEGIAKETIIRFDTHTWNILTIRLDMCCYIAGCEKVGFNNFLVTLPFDYLISEYYLVCTPFSESRILLDCEGRGVESMSLLNHNLVVHSNDRLSLSSQAFGKKFMYLNSMYKKISGNQRIVSMNVDRFNGFTNGYFVYSSKGVLSSIDLIEMHIEGNIFFSYGEMELRGCVLVCDNLIYIPINSNDDFKSTEIDDFDFGLNQNQICEKSFKFFLKDGFNGEIGILSQSLSVLLYQTGYCKPFEGGGIFIKEEKEEKDEDIWKGVVNKKIHQDEGNEECLITLGSIEEDSKYCSCIMCKKNFSFDALNAYFQMNDEVMKCPHCRQPWKEFIIYVNSLP